MIFVPDAPMLFLSFLCPCVQSNVFADHSRKVKRNIIVSEPARGELRVDGQAKSPERKANQVNLGSMKVGIIANALKKAEKGVRTVAYTTDIDARLRLHFAFPQTERLHARGRKGQESKPP
jgi:hypothetical protein